MIVPDKLRKSTHASGDILVPNRARKRYDAGLTTCNAAHHIALGDYDTWGDAERIAIKVTTLYGELSGDTTPLNPVQLFALMGEIQERRRGQVRPRGNFRLIANMAAGLLWQRT